MAKLSTGERKSLPKSDFGIPGKRAYPMPDASHARNAKARASEMEHKGRISKSTEAKIDAKADRKLGKSADRRDPNHRHPRSHAEFEALGRDD